MSVCLFVFNDTAASEIYTLSLHDALPICQCCCKERTCVGKVLFNALVEGADGTRGHEPVVGDGVVHLHSRATQDGDSRSEEHTSELQSRQYLVCRLLLEKQMKIAPR